MRIRIIVMLVVQDVEGGGTKIITIRVAKKFNSFSSQKVYVPSET